MTLGVVLARVCEVCRSWPCGCRREPPLLAYAEPTIAVERCLCGGAIVVYEGTSPAIAAAVATHNGSTTHLLWRRGMVV